MPRGFANLLVLVVAIAVAIIQRKSILSSCTTKEETEKAEVVIFIGIILTMAFALNSLPLMESLYFQSIMNVDTFMPDGSIQRNEHPLFLWQSGLLVETWTLIGWVWWSLQKLINDVTESNGKTGIATKALVKLIAPLWISAAVLSLAAAVFSKTNLIKTVFSMSYLSGSVLIAATEVTALWAGLMIFIYAKNKEKKS